MSDLVVALLEAHLKVLATASAGTIWVGILMTCRSGVNFINWFAP